MRNDVYNNRYHVPVISSPNPANEAMMRDSVNIYVMINNEFIGHVGLVIGNGEDALLYDPAGSYTGCKNNQCEVCFILFFLIFYLYLHGIHISTSIYPKILT